MSQFLAGVAVDCGPTSVLKNVGARLDRDYSLQQDRLVSTPNFAGPSTQPFQTRPPVPATEVRRPPPVSAPFDLSSLREHLSSPRITAPGNIQLAQPHDLGWARPFVSRSQASIKTAAGPTAQAERSPWTEDYQRYSERPTPLHSERAHAVSTSQARVAPWQREPLYQPFLPYASPIPYHFNVPSVPAFSQPVTPIPVTRASTGHQDIRPSTAPPEQHSAPSAPLTESQEVLARTADAFVEEFSRSNDLIATNPKLAQSKFMNLVRGLSERDVLVEDGQQPSSGDEVVEGSGFVQRSNGAVLSWAGDFLGKGSGKTHFQSFARPPYVAQVASLNLAPPTAISTTGAVHDPMQSAWDQQFSDQAAILMPDTSTLTNGQTSSLRKSVHFEDPEVVQPLDNGVPKSLDVALSSATAVPGATPSWQEDGLVDGQHDFDEAVFHHFHGEMRQEHQPRIGVGAMEGWDELQKDWEEFQRAEPWQSTLPGMGTGDRIERYLFQSQNPYTSATSDVQLQGLDSPTLRGVLELESAVQNEPTDHEAWYALGLKQQENEREDQAILALSKVVQLEPVYRPAYLALAVSYTNEGELEASNKVLERWIDLCEGVTSRDQVEQPGWEDGQRRLVERLIGIARRTPDEVDPDVQVALGVLFNSSDEYQKAEDCFLAALSAKPDDWLLWNRLGATLANSGRSNEAITYYHRALSLHPNFVRALFNLGISYMNLAQYPSAAQKIVDALRLQQADATEGYSSTASPSPGKKGVGSEVLWNTLRSACLHMGRGDLVAFAAGRELAGFPMDLEGSQRSVEEGGEVRA